MSPADELRTAAKTLRETATNAMPGPWEPLEAQGTDIVSTKFPNVFVAYDASEGDAAWIALVNPALAEPLADLLREIARQYELPPCNDPTGVCNRCEWDPTILTAEAVARAITGSAS